MEGLFFPMNFNKADIINELHDVLSGIVCCIFSGAY